MYLIIFTSISHGVGSYVFQMKSIEMKPVPF